MRRKYYWLISREGLHGKWTIEFGDYDLETVKEEFDDHLDHEVSMNDLRVIEAPVETAEWINSWLEKENGRA